MDNFVDYHENPLVLDYLNSRYFSGFQLRLADEKIEFVTSDGNILSILANAKLIKGDEDEIILDIATLVSKRSSIRKAIRDFRVTYEPEAIDLAESLNMIQAFSDPKVKERISEGFIMYTDVPVLFPRGMEVICVTAAGATGGIVDSCTETVSFSGSYYLIQLSIIVPTRKGPMIGKLGYKLPAFEAKAAIDKLGIRKISDSEKDKLTTRGETFSEFLKAPTPARYSGSLTIPGWMKDKVLAAEGRVMVDPTNFSQIDPDTYHDIMRSFQIDDDGMDTEKGIEIGKDELWRCYNRIQGFSMRLKRWGWLDVDGISPIIWRDNAFEHLVLEEKQKRAVLHLVKNYGNSFSDFIEGKSGGLIFLLHGTTGTGKTLTAEAVAEALRRPLYSVSVGELGMTPDVMEERLRSILDVAFHWNAVLLLDEADIFMEARDTTNVQRNAMVSIFLRQLEYYSGVMFLTTNRVEIFDPAFFSRISLAISYPRLDRNSRLDVWKNVLLTAEVDTSELDIEALADYEVNGRNIKTVVRISQTMAAGENRPVEQRDIVEVLTLTSAFNKLVKS